MDVETWTKFYLRGQRTLRSVGSIPAYLNGFLEASSREVMIAHEYAVKAVEKHGLAIDHLPLIEAIIAEGEVYFDRERHLTFLYWSGELERWFQVTIKCCNEKRELYVVTFHGLGADDVTRKRKRFEKVWPLPKVGR